MFKLDLEKAEEPEIKLPTSVESLIKQESSRKNIYFCFIYYSKAFNCVDHNKLWKIPQEMEIPDHFTCLLTNLFAGQKATVRTGHGTTCQGPAWGTLSMAQVMRKEAWHTQRRDQASGNPLFPSIYPKTRVCFMLSPTPLTLRGLSSITVSLGEGVNVQLQGNKNSWAWQESFSLRTALKVI